MFLWRAYEGWAIRTEDRWNTPETDSGYWDDPRNGIPLTGDHNLRKRASWEKMDYIGGPPKNHRPRRGQMHDTRGGQQRADAPVPPKAKTIPPPPPGRGQYEVNAPNAYEQCRAMLVNELLEVAAKQGVNINKSDIIFEVADDVRWNETGYGLHTMIATCKTEAGKLGAKRSFISRGILDE